jgi:hypothetical protein
MGAERKILHFTLYALLISPLPLLVFGVRANHHHFALAANDFALVANFFYG